MNKEDKGYQGVVTGTAHVATTNYCRALSIAHTYAEIYTPEELKRLLIGRGVDLTHIDVNLLHYSARKQNIINKNIFDLTGEAPKHCEQPTGRIRSLADIREAVAEVERKAEGKKGDLEILDYPIQPVEPLTAEQKTFFDRMREMVAKCSFRVRTRNEKDGPAEEVPAFDIDLAMGKKFLIGPNEDIHFRTLKSRASAEGPNLYKLDDVLKSGLPLGKLLFCPAGDAYTALTDFEGDTMDIGAMIRREKAKRSKNKRRRRARKENRRGK